MPLTPTTRASLLLRLCDSEDHEAWVEFVTLYEPVIYRSLRRHGLQDADARDVMQELLLTVSRNIDRWEPRNRRGSFRGWLRRVTRNLVIHWVKQRGRRAMPTGGCDLQSLLDALPAADDPDSIEFDRELQRALFQRASQRVRGEVHRATWEAFWETAVVGKSAADTAAKLGMTVTAVRVAKCRVLARVRTVAAEWEETE
ncbi:MAG: RNA polymerase sigma factor [Thermoguttaceae bacterium]